MAESVTLVRFKAGDGSLWETEAAAERRDEDIAEAAIVSSAIGPRPNLGHGSHVVHGLDRLRSFHRALVAWSRQRMPDLGVWANVSPQGDEVHRASIVARMADDVGGPLRDLWWRRACIDNAGREWDQPYFANQSDKDGL